MSNVKFANISEDLTAPGRPWIYYGVRVSTSGCNLALTAEQGSYAGSRAAHMKVVYPDLVYGAIASSGVTYATVEDWQYYDIIRQFADADCVKQIETAVDEFDSLASSSDTVQAIKAFYGLPNVTHIQDVASLLAASISHQSIRSDDLMNICLVGDAWRMARQELGSRCEQ
jgi:hypothetical protein